MRFEKEALIDIGERALWTAGQAFAALVLADGANWTHMATVKAAGIAALAAGLSALKSGIKAHLAARASV